MRFELRIEVGNTYCQKEPVRIKKGIEMKKEEITSRDIIIRKMHGEKLTAEQIRMVVEDIISGKLGEIEITGWLVALYINRMDDEETIAYTKALVHTGDVMQFDEKNIYDFHSIGGISGNKITPIIVSIVSAAGLAIPKTSTHAISSACGTVDFVETFCETEFTKDQLMGILRESKGFFVMGGFENHCPADDIIIKVEYTLKLNPYSQFFPSILGKKMGMGVNKLLIEIPTGPKAKIKTIDEARRTANEFVRYGEKLGLKIHVAISDGRQPIGTTIGPILEARECISTLTDPDNAPADIVEKVCRYSGILLEIGGIEDGYSMAMDILFSGKAYSQFKKIVKLQKGNPNIKSTDLKLGEFKASFFSPVDGYVVEIDNNEIIRIARAAGAPNVKVAGLIIHKKLGDRVKKGDTLFEIYSSSKEYVDTALKLADELIPYEYSDEPLEMSKSVIYEII